MKKLKVSIQDENTLVLQEDGVKGDLIDLSSLHDVEINTIQISLKLLEMGKQWQMS